MAPSEPHPFLRPLLLGGGALQLPDRILPGPMEGITAGSFVRVITGAGLVSAWVTPFLRLSTDVPRTARLREKLAAFQTPLPGTDQPPPLIVQIMGKDIPLLAAAAARLAGLGVAGVDLNCACPSPAVVANGAGGARLTDPAWVRDALLALRRACPGIGISVKLRTGRRDPAEMPAILAAVRAAQPDFIMLHLRTVAEGYSTVAHGWERLARAKELLPDRILFGSGDIFTAADALALHRQAGVDGVTPARGLLRNPWLIRDLRAACAGQAAPEPDRTEKNAFLHHLCANARDAGDWRPGFILELARNLFGVRSARFRRLTEAATPDAMLAVLDSPDRHA